MSNNPEWEKVPRRCKHCRNRTVCSPPKGISHVYKPVQWCEVYRQYCYYVYQDCENFEQVINFSVKR